MAQTTQAGEATIEAAKQAIERDISIQDRYSDTTVEPADGLVVDPAPVSGEAVTVEVNMDRPGSAEIRVAIIRELDPDRTATDHQERTWRCAVDAR